ncbi:hypothetical protein [Methylomonas rhizoryzae]|uniref:hypothetical protein n=1 Tax=Methylomonas rhizoryzae TaxID=2608981 RepID=UPI001231A3C4|nr:hypothetical protein [Methylomonas rhizoryzae]
MTTELTLDVLPPIQADKQATAVRQLQIRLPVQVFLKLELDAARRGMTSYKLASAVLSMYLNGKLVQKKELLNGPETDQQPLGGDQ